MLFGGLLLGGTVVGFAFWLHWNERLGWPDEDYDREGSRIDRDYLARRSRGRRRVHVLLGGCGALIIVAALGGPETPRLWIACWLSVVLTLVTVIFLAAFDAYRTQRYHAAKLPELRRGRADRSSGTPERPSGNADRR